MNYNLVIEIITQQDWLSLQNQTNRKEHHLAAALQWPDTARGSLKLADGHITECCIRGALPHTSPHQFRIPLYDGRWLVVQLSQSAQQPAAPPADAHLPHEPCDGQQQSYWEMKAQEKELNDL